MGHHLVSHQNLVDENMNTLKNINVLILTYDDKFDDSLALTPEVNTISPRSPGLMTFHSWRQKSRKSVPEVPIL